ncbi:MAG: cell division protein FtsZ, partial [Acidimicrobiaceae bacterium]|nr:cell division protein FtsZ [Acidimicrobiaceae bacterium]
LMGIGNGSGEGRAVAAARASISSPLLEASIENARGILLNISGGTDLGLLEINEAAEIIHGVAHQDANIIFGAVIDDEMGDDVRVTVIAAGFDRWDDSPSRASRLSERSGDTQADSGELTGEVPIADVFATDDDDALDLGDDDFDVPSFLK